MKKGIKNINRKKLIIILVALAVVLAAAALIVHLSTRLTNESYVNCSLGDVNGDGYINALDSMLIIDSTTDDKLLFESQKKLADVNEDGVVNSSDSLILMRYIVGEIKSIPYDDTAEPKPDKSSLKAEAEKDATKFAAQIKNEWDNGDGTHSYQIDCVVKNKSSEITNWNVEIIFSGKATITKKWNCEAKSKSGIVTLTGDGTSEDCGFIVTARSGLAIKSVEINN